MWASLFLRKHWLIGYVMLGYGTKVCWRSWEAFDQNETPVGSVSAYVQIFVAWERSKGSSHSSLSCSCLQVEYASCSSRVSNVEGWAICSISNYILGLAEAKMAACTIIHDRRTPSVWYYFVIPGPRRWNSLSTRIRNAVDLQMTWLLAVMFHCMSMRTSL